MLKIHIYYFLEHQLSALEAVVGQWFAIQTISRWYDLCSARFLKQNCKLLDCRVSYSLVPFFCHCHESKQTPVKSDQFLLSFLLSRWYESKSSKEWPGHLYSIWTCKGPLDWIRTKLLFKLPSNLRSLVEYNEHLLLIVKIHLKISLKVPSELCKNIITAKDSCKLV